MIYVDGQPLLASQLNGDFDTVRTMLVGANLLTLINQILPLVPKIQPATTGILWNNGGFLCVS